MAAAVDENNIHNGDRNPIAFNDADDHVEADDSRLSTASSAETYHDSYISCTATTLMIRAYYFPWGSKTIALSSLQAIERVPLGVLSGRGRIWGTANPGVWAHLDLARPSKTEGLVLHVGQGVTPLVTPRDVDALVGVLVRHTGLEVHYGQGRFV